MKRWIHASTGSSEALDELKSKYTNDQITLVEQCRNEMLEEYDYEEISEIHWYWLNKAEEEELLDEEQFDNIYSLLDKIVGEDSPSSIRL